MTVSRFTRYRGTRSYIDRSRRTCEGSHDAGRVEWMEVNGEWLPVSVCVWCGRAGLGYHRKGSRVDLKVDGGLQRHRRVA